MKKYLLLLYLPMLVLAAGCKKNITEVIVPNKIVMVTIAAENWGTTDQKNWIVDKNIPELAEKYVTKRATLVYRVLAGQNNEQWPVNYEGLAYSYSIRASKIVFNVTHADGQTVIARPAAMTFKVVLIEAE